MKVADVQEKVHGGVDCVDVSVCQGRKYGSND